MFNLSNSTKLVAASGFIICALLLGSAYPALAQSNSLLGTAQSFAVLGGSTVTNTGSTTVDGDLGVSPGSEVTGFVPSGPGIVANGTIHTADEVASQAQTDVTTAYNTLAGLECESGSEFDLTGQDLGGMTLVPGVYCFSSSAQLTGALTLDAVGNPDASFVFQIGSTLTTASNSSVLIIGGSECNVFWQVGSSATLDTTTSFQGNILALTSITLNTGATVSGRALARNGAVTLDTNNVSNAGCAVASETPTATPEIPTATPEPPTATPEVPTATPAPATATPAIPTATPVPATATPAIPTATPAFPGAGGQGPATSTPVVTNPATPSPVTATPAASTPAVPIAGTPAPITPTPTRSIEMTQTPTPTTPLTPVGQATATGVPATPTTLVTQTPTTWPTSTPAPTGSAVTNVTFPNTGSGGMLATQNDQSMTITNLAISLALVVLLTGGIGFVVERRSRR